MNSVVSTVQLSRVAVVALIAAMLSIEVALPRIGESRLNYPVFFALGLVALLLGLRKIVRRGVPSLPVLSTLALALYAAWCAASYGWSYVPGETLLHACVLVFGCGLAVTAASDDPNETVRSFVYACALVFVCSWIALIVAPGYALQTKGYWRLQGIMGHEFRLGYLASATLVILAFGFLNPKWRYRLQTSHRYAIAALAAATLAATMTRTLFIYTAICLAIVGLVHARGYRRALVILALVLAASIAFLFGADIVDMFMREDNDLESLSGRAMIWERTIYYAAQLPWGGAGFASFPAPEFDYMWGWYRPPHAHNSLLNAYFETGLIGASLLVGLVLALAKDALSAARRRALPSAGAYVLLLCMLSGLTGLIFGGKLSTLMLLVVVLVFQEFNQAYSRKAATTTMHKARS